MIGGINVHPVMPVTIPQCQSQAGDSGELAAFLLIMEWKAR